MRIRLSNYWHGAGKLSRTDAEFGYFAKPLLRNCALPPLPPSDNQFFFVWFLESCEKNCANPPFFRIFRNTQPPPNQKPQIPEHVIFESPFVCQNDHILVATIGFAVKRFERLPAQKSRSRQRIGFHSATGRSSGSRTLRRHRSRAYRSTASLASMRACDISGIGRLLRPSVFEHNADQPSLGRPPIGAASLKPT